jgi:hypothetical protein
MKIFLLVSAKAVAVANKVFPLPNLPVKRVAGEFTNA